jgi:N-hydroxyarylamine O-acetyltransferase
MSPAVDLDAYFQRIKCEIRQKSLDVLRQLHFHHTQNIAFENLNPLLGIPVRLDLQSLQQKLLYEERGGYCFEQNILFGQVLKTLGFPVKGLEARVLLNAGEQNPRTHMLLLVLLQKNFYICDVGFGGMVPTAPLLLETGKVQYTPHEPYRLIKKGTNFILQVFLWNDWKSLYSFDLQEQSLRDYEVSSWYSSASPNSHFTKSLIVTRTAPGCRYTLSNNKFSIHHLNRDTEKYFLSSGSQLKEVLEETFGLKLTKLKNLDAKLEQIVAQSYKIMKNEATAK